MNPNVISTLIDKVADIEKKVAQENKPYQLATVDPDYISGKPKLTFHGSSKLSPFGFTCLSSYTPVAGDIVLVAVVGGGYVVLGSLNTFGN